MAGPDDDEQLGTRAFPLQGVPPVDISDAAEEALFGGGSFWVGLQASLARRSDGRNEAGALVLLGIPLEHFGRRQLSRAGGTTAGSGIAEGKKGEPTPLLPAPAHAPGAEPPPKQRDAAHDGTGTRAAEPVPVVPLRITSETARTAVARALEHARLSGSDVVLDAVASRARMSGLLPELRLRVTRSMDESESLGMKS